MHTLYAGPFSRRRFVRGITLAGTAELLGHACKTEFHAWPVHRCSHASGCNTVRSTPAPQQSGRRREERLRVTRGSCQRR